MLTASRGINKCPTPGKKLFSGTDTTTTARQMPVSAKTRDTLSQKSHEAVEGQQ